MLFHRYRLIVAMFLIVLSVPSIHAAQDSGSAAGAGWMSRAYSCLPSMPSWLGGSSAAVSVSPDSGVAELARPNSAGSDETLVDGAAAGVGAVRDGAAEGAVASAGDRAPRPREGVVANRLRLMREEAAAKAAAQEAEKAEKLASFVGAGGNVDVFRRNRAEEKAAGAKLIADEDAARRAADERLVARIQFHMRADRAARASAAPARYVESFEDALERYEAVIAEADAGALGALDERYVPIVKEVIRRMRNNKASYPDLGTAGVERAPEWNDGMVNDALNILERNCFSVELLKASSNPCLKTDDLYHTAVALLASMFGGASGAGDTPAIQAMKQRLLLAVVTFAPYRFNDGIPGLIGQARDAGIIDDELYVACNFVSSARRTRALNARLGR